jgi:hypothetical protein
LGTRSQWDLLEAAKSLLVGRDGGVEVG